MSKPKLSEALCQKLENIVEAYVKNYPDEWQNFKKQQSYKRAHANNDWAEVNGEQGIVIRALLDTPATLYALIKATLSDVEFLEFTEEKYKIWFGNRFPDMKWIEGKL